MKNFPRLRRISVSAWANPATMGEYLGREYILSLKPSPTPLGQTRMDQEFVRKEIRSALDETRKNIVELIMKDNHTLGGNPTNATRWVEIVREEIERH